MPLDSVGRRYADSLFANSLEDIAKSQGQERSRITEEFAGRGTAHLSAYVSALVTADVHRIPLLAEARVDSLLRAYERSGLGLDDSALQEISAEVTELCSTQQQDAVADIGPTVRQLFPRFDRAVEDAVAEMIKGGARAVISRVIRDLRIRRDEVILDETKARRVYGAGLGKEWDAFVCHASEDKEEFACPLARALRDSGLRVWFDESTLRIGDSLRAAIDGGLARSRFGIVVLSNNFFAKRWPQQELDGLVAKQVAGVKVILPVWHNISVDDVRRNSPMLAGRLAAKSSDGIEVVVRQLREAMGL